jgi:benzoate/toluate 1,2-dioxygenase beta subunit
VGELRDRCEEFVFDEAELLDENRYEEWVDLFTEDGAYWLPLDTSRSEPRDALNIIYDDRRRLEDRVSRLRGGHAHSEDPISSTQHLVGNVRVLPHERIADIAGTCVLGTDDVLVSGRSVIVRSRRDEIDVFHARVSWVLQPGGESFRIRMKRVDLVGAQRPLPMMTYIV